MTHRLPEKSYAEEMDGYMATRPFSERFLWRFRERMFTRYMEEGHALAALLLPEPKESNRTKPRGRDEGFTWWKAFKCVLAILLRRNRIGRDDWYHGETLAYFHNRNDGYSWSCNMVELHSKLRYSIDSDGECFV